MAKREMMIIGAAIVIIIAVGLIYSSIDKNGEEIKDYCLVDEECAPALGCHPDSCILKSSINGSERVICTQECKPGTLDCGQGYCACVNKKCEAIIE